MASTRNPALARTSAWGPQLALSNLAPWASTTPRFPAPYRSAQIIPPSAVGNETSLGAAVSPVIMRHAMANLRIAARTLLTWSGVEIRHAETAIHHSALKLLRVDDLAVSSDLGLAGGNNRRIEEAGVKTIPAAGERLRRADGRRIHP